MKNRLKYGILKKYSLPTSSGECSVPVPSARCSVGGDLEIVRQYGGMGTIFESCDRRSRKRTFRGTNDECRVTNRASVRHSSFFGPGLPSPRVSGERVARGVREDARARRNSARRVRGVAHVPAVDSVLTPLSPTPLPVHTGRGVPKHEGGRVLQLTTHNSQPGGSASCLR